MSDRPDPKTRSENQRHASEKSIEAAVRDSFPASDSPAPTATQGVRAVPPERLADQGPPPAGATATIERHFPDAESAKMALEALVREGPLDRRSAEIRQAPPGEGAVLTLRVAPADRSRLEGLLRRQSEAGAPGRQV